ncbi:Thiosulfate reductase cytochrome B subunit (membrane anchoring protein) [Pacificimonas flava]|uniref:Thiosulfate reductase cytochrome B subunit (Membrane anchoring protein) n=1 Tax=Pacificimonas flava TaxID=1234595 RepID=M2U702_9SPHN|nr:Thiosulfate reductase cytochrome B subunit (membrane anchoring protein) [Pacificimonas flava]
MHRHALPVRLWHWLNVIAVFVLLGSGLSIFNAHPRLYWGQYGANFDPAWLEIGSRDGGQEGFLRIGPLEVETTGILGVFEKDGSLRRRAWPHYLTIPADYSLAQGRLYHLFTAWIFGIAGLAYALWSVAGRHFRRDLLPARKEMAPRHIWHDVKQHARLRLPKGEAALRYNILQKFSYLFVLFVLLPMMVLTGLAMSPNMNAAWPWLLDLFGGRQSARSLHFIAAFLIAGFILVHIIMVIAAGPLNEIRSMITGRFRIREDRP